MKIKRTTEITGNSSTLLKELQVGDKIQIAKAWWKVPEEIWQKKRTLKTR